MARSSTQSLLQTSQVPPATCVWQMHPDAGAFRAEPTTVSCRAGLGALDSRLCWVWQLQAPGRHLSREALHAEWPGLQQSLSGSVMQAYQVLRAGGLPEERIVVMMADDIAHNPLNPHKGKLINRPGGPDVYEGVPKDYTGPAVNVGNFMSVLRGDNVSLAPVPLQHDGHSLS